jgi:copper chaperone CopZ
MSTDVSGDQLVLIRIDGMHCHRCEQAIRKAMQAYPGVHEVEVDFNSGQASVLYAGDQVSVDQLLGAVAQAGYHVAGFNQPVRK